MKAETSYNKSFPQFSILKESQLIFALMDLPVLNLLLFLSLSELLLQRSAKVDAPSLVNLIPAVAYHSCLNLPAAFTQPGASTLADLCISGLCRLPSILRTDLEKERSKKRRMDGIFLSLNCDTRHPVSPSALVTAVN